MEVERNPGVENSDVRRKDGEDEDWYVDAGLKKINKKSAQSVNTWDIHSLTLSIKNFHS